MLHETRAHRRSHDNLLRDTTVMLALPGDVVRLLARSHLRALESLTLRITCRRLRALVPLPHVGWFLYADAIGAQCHVALLDYLHDTVGLRWDESQHGCPVKYGARLCALAASRAKLGTLRWLHAHGAQWDASACTAAAAANHRDVLVYLRSNGCAWNKETSAAAAEHGHTRLLQWMRTQGAPLHESLCARAAMNGHWRTVRWARENANCALSESVACSAAAQNNLDALAWLREVRAPADSRVALAAAAAGHLQALCWLLQEREPRPPFDTGVQQWCAIECARAALEHGHLHVLRWLVQRHARIPLGEQACALAAQNGHVRVLCWLRRQRAPCDVTAALGACYHAHVPVLEYLHSIGAPFDADLCSTAALYGRHWHVLRWLRAHGMLCNEDIMQQARDAGACNL